MPGADGGVDLYLMPGYDDIASLYLIDGEWKPYYVFDRAPAVANEHEPARMTLFEGTVIRVLDELVAHAA